MAVSSNSTALPSGKARTRRAALAIFGGTALGVAATGALAAQQLASRPERHPDAELLRLGGAFERQMSVVKAAGAHADYMERAFFAPLLADRLAGVSPDADLDVRYECARESGWDPALEVFWDEELAACDLADAIHVAPVHTAEGLAVKWQALHYMMDDVFRLLLDDKDGTPSLERKRFEEFGQQLLGLSGHATRPNAQAYCESQ